MAGIARLVVPRLARHVTQRGNRRERVFFGEEDDRACLDLLAASAQKSATRLIAARIRKRFAAFWFRCSRRAVSWTSAVLLEPAAALEAVRSLPAITSAIVIQLPPAGELPAWIQS